MPGQPDTMIPCERSGPRTVLLSVLALCTTAFAVYLALWALKLTRAVFLPGNLLLELHWFEVALLFALGVELLIAVLRSIRGGALVLRLDDGRIVECRHEVVIGQEPGAGGVSITAPQVSRQHVVIAPAGDGRFRVRDLGSTNGSFVDSEDIRPKGEVVAEPGAVVELGLSGPRVELARLAPQPLIGSGWRLTMLLALLWIGLGLGWLANVERLPELPLVVGDVAVTFEVFTGGGVIMLLGAFLSMLLGGWSLAVRSGAKGAGSSPFRVVHHAAQLMLVLGVVVLYPLLPAESLRYAEAAERCAVRIDDAAGEGAFTALLKEKRSGVAPSAELGIGESERGQFKGGLRSLQLAVNLGARGDAAAFRTTWLRQIIGVVAGVICFLILPLVWPGLRRLVSMALIWLSKPLVRSGAGGGLVRPLLYGDVFLGLLAAFVVVVTVFTPLGTSLGRGKSLWLSVPGLGTLQSIEVVKALFLVFMASYFARVGRLLEVAPRARYLGPFLVATSAALAMTAVQADMGGLLMLGLLVAGVFIVGTGAWRLLSSVPILVGLGLGLAAMLGKLSIVMTRLALWVDPRHHWDGSQVVEARQLLLSAGWSGYGPGRCLAWRIPDVHGDLVVAALTERFGLLGLVGLIAAWTAMALALLVAAVRMRRGEAVGALLLAGMAVLLVVQVLTQCGGLLGLMPFTGVPLPWISHGLSASLMFTALLGLALAAGMNSSRRGSGSALPVARVRVFGSGVAAVFVVVMIASAWWLVAAAPMEELGPRGRNYRWVDRRIVERIDVLVDAGLFAQKGATSRVVVDRDAYRQNRAEFGDEGAPDLLELIRMTEGLRWRDGGVRPMPYMISDPNRFAQRALPRGWILDRQGRALAMNDGEGRRVYPLKQAALHIVGVPRGRTSGLGLEARSNGMLTGSDFGRALKIRAFANDVHHGADLGLTIDAQLQRSAYRVLEGRRGAAVVMALDDGALLALASSPAPDPEAVDGLNWQSLTSGTERPLLNRATASTSFYSPPGSTFKMVIAVAALLAEGSAFDPRATILCDGYDEELDVRCAHRTAHGNVDLKTALTVSCNAYFARTAVALGPERILEACKRFGFNPDFQLDLAEGLDHVVVPVSPSTVVLDRLRIPDDRALARVGFGQGPVSATPLQMAQVGAVLATRGRLVQPYLVASLALGGTDEDGRRVALWKREIRRRNRDQVIPSHVAAQISHHLRAVFESSRGTASFLPALWQGEDGWRLAAAKPGEEWERVAVSGKTGSSWKTAGDTKDDAWIVVWAPTDKPQVVVCVMLEDAGSGGRVAGPVAMELLRESLEMMTVVSVR